MIVMTFAGFYTYAYFSQSGIIHDDTCHSPFQCIIKHILDSFRADITTVVGMSGSAWAFPATTLWADSWYALRTFYIFTFLIFWSFLLQPVLNGHIITAFVKLRKDRQNAVDEMEVVPCSD